MTACLRLKNLPRSDQHHLLLELTLENTEPDINDVFVDAFTFTVRYSKGKKSWDWSDNLNTRQNGPLFISSMKNN